MHNTPTHNTSVLVLDSGIGGLSITQEIRKLCPGLHINYLADLAAFPYGTKSGDQIIERILHLMDRLVPIEHPALVVVACNTASTVALSAIREKFHIPVVGVVPAIKPAATLTQTGVIGMLATEGTVNRSYTHNLIQEFAGHCNVFLHGSARLVLLAEEKLRYGSVDPKKIKAEVTPLITNSADMDTVVLACTHFPLLGAELTQAFPQIRFWVDSGAAIARRVAHLLSDAGVPADRLYGHKSSEKNRFINTDAVPIKYDESALLKLLGNFESELLPY